MTLREMSYVEAETYRKAAERSTDSMVRDMNLRKAADRYRAAGRYGMAEWCERFIGK